MQTNKNSALSEISQQLTFLKLDSVDESSWFDSFDEIDDSLTQTLLLVAVMKAQGIIKDKEGTQMKKYFLTLNDKKTA